MKLASPAAEDGALRPADTLGQKHEPASDCRPGSPQTDRSRHNATRAAMNGLHANLAILRRGSRSNNQAAIAMFNKFQPKPLRKAARYDSVASKIAPDSQPPIAIPD